LEVAGKESNTNKVQNRINTLATALAKEQVDLVAARNTVSKKESAYHRKVDTENMRQHLQEVKK
jgi:hypothetical protein